MSYQSKQYRELQAVWYKKLKEQGFEDIEDTSKSDRPLEAWHSLRFQKVVGVQVDMTQAYYYRAKELLNTYQFKNKTHQRVWELHCEGLSKREIAEEIKNLEKTYKRESIGLIIKNIAKKCK